MTRWAIAELPPLQAADIVLTRNNALSSRFIRWLLCSDYSHALMIAWPVRLARLTWDYAIIESIAKGVSPGSLVDFYSDQNIAVVRYRGLSSFDGKKIVKEALGYGRKSYDWLLPLAITRKYGWCYIFRLLYRRLTGRMITLPHIEDGRVVCTELIQECYSHLGFRLCRDDVLLPPDTHILRAFTCEVIFRSDVAGRHDQTEH